MIITKTIEINVGIGNVTHYRKLGYVLKVSPKSTTKLTVSIEDLQKGSHTKIDASCDICNKVYKVPYKDYLNSHEKYKFDTCNKCKFEKIKITNNERYGSDTPLQNSDILKKYFKTNNERYGGNSSSCSEKILDKQRKTRINNGLEISGDKSVSNFKKYRNRVDTLTKKNKKQLFKEWDGYDFYDNEYIKNNFELKHYDRSYPTIEHKISVFFGFVNNINESEISKLDNLVITKRWINSTRRNKDITLFQESFNKII